jgi:type I restriction enzyme S subunit
MGAEHPSVLLGDVVTVRSGFAFSSRDWTDSGVPVVKIGNVKHGRLDMDGCSFVDPSVAAQAKEFDLRTDDILIAMTGYIGDVAWVRPQDLPAVLNQRVGRFSIRDGTKVDRRFLFYVLRSPEIRAAIEGLGYGSAQPNVSPSLIHDVDIPLPPLTEQRAIAGILGALDDKIELNRRMNGTLEEMARAIFKSWFVDFDPVCAKAEGRDSGLPHPLADLFPSSFEDSVLGEIPKGWQVEELGEVLSEVECGGRPRGGVSGYTAGVPSIGAESIVGLGQFDYSKTRYVSQEFFDRMTKGHVRSRDILLYKDGGRPGEFEPHATIFGDGFPFRICAINEHVYRLRARQSFGQNLLFFWLSSDLVMEEMRTKGTGVAIPGLNSTQLRSVTTLVPTDEVACAFNARVEPWIAQILSSCTGSRALAALRDALLPKLLSGQLRVDGRSRHGGHP